MTTASATRIGSIPTAPSLLGRLTADPAAFDVDEAWAELVRRYGPHIYRWCLQWGGRPADAADVTQDVLVRLFRRLPQFEYDKARGGFRAYLKTLVRYAWSDFVADRRAVGAAAAGGTGLDELNRLAQAPARDDLEQRLGEEFDREIAAAAMTQVAARVAPQTWEAFRLQAVECVPVPEVAARLGMRVASVYKARSNVTKMLREAVRELGG